jgi:hypothetical protein
MAIPTGFGPAISALTGPHVSRYTTGSNERKIVYHALYTASRPVANQFYHSAPKTSAAFTKCCAKVTLTSHFSLEKLV